MSGCCDKKENKTFPSKTKMAKSFAKAAVKHVASGFATREKKEIRRITLICEECDLYVNGRCRKCGCSLRKKIQWLTTHCKLKKW